jgi:hypothetical protein
LCCHSVGSCMAERMRSAMQSVCAVLQRGGECCDSRLRCGRQRDRDARARGRLQRAVKFWLVLPCVPR